MEDSYIIANFHTLCRLCLHKSTFSTSIFAAAPDDEANIALTSKLAECLDLQVSYVNFCSFFIGYNIIYLEPGIIKHVISD